MKNIPKELAKWHIVKTEFGKWRIISTKKWLWEILLSNWVILKKPQDGLRHIKQNSKSIAKEGSQFDSLIAKYKSDSYTYWELPEKEKKFLDNILKKLSEKVKNIFLWLNLSNFEKTNLSISNNKNNNQKSAYVIDQMSEDEEVCAKNIFDYILAEFCIKIDFENNLAKKQYMKSFLDYIIYDMFSELWIITNTKYAVVNPKRPELSNWLTEYMYKKIVLQE